MRSASGATASLAVEGLTKRYGRKYAARDVTFSMSSGEVVGLLGPNGAGKTTVFYLIVGFMRPTAGRIFLSGDEITRLPMYRRARSGISYLPQEPSVFRKLTVEQNLLAVLETQRGLTRSSRRHRCDEILDELGLEDLRRQRAYTLSAVSGAAPRSAARWQCGRGSCCSTSRLPASTRLPCRTSR